MNASTLQDDDAWRTDAGHTAHTRPGATPAADRDRVRHHTAAAVVRCIDDETREQLEQYEAADAKSIATRLEALDRQWDTDRAIGLEASTMGLVGVALATLVRREFLAVPAMVGAGLVLHALTGRYPLMPVFRRLGLRTSREIARERYALKALRGDFAALTAQSSASSGTAERY
jgi:hypothetical protein